MMSRKKFILVVLGVALAFGVIASNAAYFLQNHSSPQPAATASQTPEKVYSIPVQSPPSAQSIAKELACRQFKDLGKAADGMVLDSGSCYINGHKFAIDVFPSEAAKTAWLAMARKYGVTPTTWTKTWVVYPSVG
jgi:hypothetical protein